jgi:MtrB/PioB family decaheme-associated outer membrane protein
MRTARSAALLIAGIGVASPAMVRAQVTVTGAADVGIRTFLKAPGDSALTKFLQYNNMPVGLDWQSPYFHAPGLPGVLVQSLYLQVLKDSSASVMFNGHDVGLQDQNLSLRANQPGYQDLQLRWDRIPHVFSTDSRFPDTETSPGVFTLPTPRPDTAHLNSAPYGAPVEERWDPVKASYTFSPSRSWDLKVEVQHIQKSGDRPMGMVFGGSSNNAQEIMEPIDQSMTDFRISQAYTGRRFQGMVSYAYSNFSNALQSVTADNPLVTVDSLRAGTSRGRTSLAPSNDAQTLTGVAAVSLPQHTRVTGTLAYSYRTQNERMLPPTINAKNLDSLTRAGDVYPTGLFGDVRTSLVNLTLTSRPIRDLSVSAHYRSYQLIDNTPVDSVPILVISDRTFSPGASSVRFPYRQDNADGSVSAHPIPELTLTGGYSWSQMTRDSIARNTTQVYENTGHFSADYTGTTWATARITYSYGERRNDGYYQTTTSENPLSQRFDESNRNRSALDLLVTMTPVDKITLVGSYEVGRDTFPNSVYGVQHDNTNSIGVELEWAPMPRLSFGAGYERDWSNNLFNSEYRTGSTAATLSNQTWNWVATNIDSSTTAFITVAATLIPNRLEFTAMWQIAQSAFQMQAYNPVAPSGGTAAQNAAATAMSFPAATQELEPFTLDVRYVVSPDWSLTARFQGEHFTNYNFQTTGLAPATGNYVFQGNSLLPYDAAYFTFMVSFRPGLIKRPRSAI